MGKRAGLLQVARFEKEDNVVRIGKTAEQAEFLQATYIPRDAMIIVSTLPSIEVFNFMMNEQI